MIVFNCLLWEGGIQFNKNICILSDYPACESYHENKITLYLLIFCQ